MSNLKSDQSCFFKSCFLQAIRQVRLDSQLTQLELAQKIGKPQSFVSKYESGQRGLDFHEVYLICNALNITVNNFTIIFEDYINNSI
jgi:transcriptional regulator with XRE-family HTH domain